MLKKGFLNIYMAVTVAVVIFSGLAYYFANKNSTIPAPDGLVAADQRNNLPAIKAEEMKPPDLVPAQKSKSAAGKSPNPLAEQKEENLISPEASQTADNQPPLFLKSIGINLDYYDPATGRAGDFAFTREKLHFGRLFMGFGFFIPASSASPDKYNPQPTFILPLGTPVRSLVDGVVANIPTLWSGDYSIQVTTNGKLEKWIYETEHVLNPKVKVGDKVKAGEIVGEVSNFDRGVPAGFGAVEIGVLRGGRVPEHVCPFAYLDPSIKEETEKKIISLFKSWEEYSGNSELYDKSNSIPGCLTLEPVEG